MADIECDGGPHCGADRHLEGCFATMRSGAIDRAGHLQAENDNLRHVIASATDVLDYILRTASDADLTEDEVRTRIDRVGRKMLATIEGYTPVAR